jgi:hypothetical protein
MLMYEIQLHIRIVKALRELASMDIRGFLTIFMPWYGI